MNILVTGANGQLGREIRLVSRGGDDTYIFTDVTDVPGLETVRLDITDPEAVRRLVREHGVDVVVNCAAWTDVDGAEDPAAYDAVEWLNADAPENLAMAMKEAGGLLIHISTDYVFGKEPFNVPCGEDRTGAPIGVYGATKFLGEQKITASGCRCIIIRTSWLYSEFGRNFCKTMLGLTASRPRLKVVFDQVGTPTYALDLANAIAVILDKVKEEGDKYTGIYHFSDEGVCSWYDFARTVARHAAETGAPEWKACADCDIRPCHSVEFPSPVRRPAYSVLDKTKIKATFGVEIPYWADSVKRCIDNILRIKETGR